MRTRPEPLEQIDLPGATPFAIEALEGLGFSYRSQSSSSRQRGQEGRGWSGRCTARSPREVAEAEAAVGERMVSHCRSAAVRASQG